MINWYATRDKGARQVWIWRGEVPPEEDPKGVFLPPAKGECDAIFFTGFAKFKATYGWRPESGVCVKLIDVRFSPRIGAKGVDR